MMLFSDPTFEIIWGTLTFSIVVQDSVIVQNSVELPGDFDGSSFCKRLPLSHSFRHLFRPFLGKGRKRRLRTNLQIVLGSLTLSSFSPFR